MLRFALERKGAALATNPHYDIAPRAGTAVQGELTLRSGRAQDVRESTEEDGGVYL